MVRASVPSIGNMGGWNLLPSIGGEVGGVTLPAPPSLPSAPTVTGEPSDPTAPGLPTAPDIGGLL